MAGREMATVTYHPYTKRFYSADVHDTDVSKGDDHLGHIMIGEFHPEREFGDGRYIYQAEVMRRAERKYYQGLITDADITNIKVTELIGELLFRQWRDFYGILGVTRYPVPKLHAAIPILGKYRASEKVPEGVEATEKKSTYTKATFDLWKNVVDINATIEAQYKGVFNPLQVDIDQAAGALTEVENEQVITVIESFTTSAEASWATQTSGVSDNNPVTDINALLETLMKLHARPKFIGLSSVVAGNYLTNTWVKGQMLAPSSQMMGGLYPVPLFPGLQFLVDPFFTGTKATLFDPRGVAFGEGPVVAEEYRQPKAFRSGFAIAKFIQPLKTSNNFGRTMTSVS